MRFAVDPFTETYYEVAGLLSSLARKFSQRHRIDPEEAESLANLGFVRAYHSYDLERGLFPDWVVRKAWKCMLSGLRSKIKQESRPVKSGIDTDTISKEERERFRVEEFVHGMTADAKRLVVMTFLPPKEVKKLVKSFGKDSAINQRMAMRHILMQEGWRESRIKKAFKEVRRAL